MRSGQGGSRTALTFVRWQGVWFTWYADGFELEGKADRGDDPAFQPLHEYGPAPYGAIPVLAGTEPAKEHHPGEEHDLGEGQPAPANAGDAKMVLAEQIGE